MSTLTIIVSSLGGLLVLVAGFYKWYMINQQGTAIAEHVKASEKLMDDKQVKEYANAKDHAINTSAVDLLNELHTSGSARAQGTNRAM